MTVEKAKRLLGRLKRGPATNYDLKSAVAAKLRAIIAGAKALP